MSNLAVGIALGAAMNSTSGYSGGSVNLDMPAWVAIICIATLAACIIATVVKLYSEDSCLLESHWERLILGPAIGVCIWFCIATVLGLFAWLLSFVF